MKIKLFILLGLINLTSLLYPQKNICNENNLGSPCITTQNKKGTCQGPFMGCAYYDGEVHCVSPYQCQTNRK